jgi:hypothetical protein
MNELKKTSVFVAVAVLLSATAVLATRPRIATNPEFKEQGELFFPTFKDPLTCTALEVIDYDPSTASAIPFKVALKDGKWAIPSHHDYPADAKDRLAKTASGVVDLKKDVIVSDRADQQEDFGVLDPLDTKTTSLKGRGKRVTLKNKSGEVLADFIIGKEVPGRTNQRYVRVPGQKRTYGVNVNVELSTKFSDWIETNLLKLDSFKIRSVTFDNHKVDPEAGTFAQGEIFKIERKDGSAPWTLTTLAPEKQELPADMEVDSSKVTSLTSALADLKIVGVRPKPAGLTSELKATGDGKGIRLSRASQVSLSSRGFYLTRDGRLLSNTGDVLPTTDEGIIYTLRFGEVTFATGDALTAGSEEEEKSKAAAEGKKKAEGASENRYLFVTAEFDPTFLPPAPTPPKVEKDEELPADPFARTTKEKADKEKEDKEKYDRDKADHDRKVDDGKKRAKELTDRFAGWYYVVPGDAFRSVVLEKTALVKKKGDKPADSTPAGLPNFSPSGLTPPGGGHP